MKINLTKHDDLTFADLDVGQAFLLVGHPNTLLLKATDDHFISLSNPHLGLRMTFRSDRVLRVTITELSARVGKECE